MVELTAADDHKLSAYRADPSGTPKGAVLVVQDVTGVTARLRKIADDLAARGYVAIAPSLFDRVKAGVELGYDEASLAEGATLAKGVGEEQSLKDIQAAIDAVGEAGKVAILGYGWGGYLAYLSTNRAQGLACAVGYYGRGIVDQYREKRKAPTLLHFGDSDPFIPFEEILQLRAHRPDVSVFTYPEAGDGFDCDARDTYRDEAALLAWERTLFWISQYVEGQPPIQLKNAGAYAAAKTERKKKPAGAMADGPPE